MNVDSARVFTRLHDLVYFCGKNDYYSKKMTKSCITFKNKNITSGVPVNDDNMYVASDVLDRGDPCRPE